MSFVNRFKPAGNPPPGVKIEHTSFGYAQNQKPYTVPTLPPQKQPAQRVQPRGGWDEDEDDEPQLRSGNGANRGIQIQTQVNNKKPFVGQSPLTAGSNKSDDLNLGPSNKRVNPAKDYELMQIDDQFLSNHEFENKTINDLVQPGGARVKPTDTALNTFCKACESFQVPVIGTLLLSKLYEELPFVSKARTLYLIEAIVKKVKKYLEYFKYNLSTLQGANYSNDPSADQLAKISNDIVSYIQEPNKPKPQPTFPTNLTHYSNPTPTIPVQQTTDLLGTNDLLGSPEAKTSKPDPFAFVKKPTAETVKSSTPSSRPQATQPQQNNNQLLDLDFGGSTKPITSQPQQSFQQTQPVSQPTKKFNPFDVPTQNKPQPVAQPVVNQPTATQNTTTKPSGLPGNFKKFQSASSSSALDQTPTQQSNKAATPVNQASAFDRMDDLLGSLDFSSGPAPAQNTFTQATNSFNTTQQTSSPGLKSSFPPTQPPTTNQFNQPPSSFGQNFSNTPNLNVSTGVNFNQPNPYGGSNMGNMGPMGGMNSGPSGYGFNNNSFPGAGAGYGQGPTGFGAAPQGNWNMGGYSGGYSGMNQPHGQGYGYGQMGGYGQGQNFGGNNFQGYNGMGGGSYQNQGHGMNAYYNQPGSPDQLSMGGNLGMYSAEAIANQEEVKKKQEKAKNESLFDSLKF